jgi:hypothetical protein
MNLRIIEAEIKSLDEVQIKACTYEERLRLRNLALSGTILFANEQKAEFLILRGAITNLLSQPDIDLKVTGHILNEFAGDAVIMVADVEENLFSRFRPFIDRKRVILMPDDSGKNIRVNETLQMIASMQITTPT